MKFLVIVKATRNCEAGLMPSPEVMAAMGKYNEELAKAGVLVACEVLYPTAEGKRVRFNGKERSVVDGPFMETKELAGGFWLWNCASMDEAVAWLKKCPNPHSQEPFEMEIRRIREVKEFSNAAAA